LKNTSIREYVIFHLKKRWSPEQIAGRIRLDLRETVSHEAIYQFIYAQVYRNGWGELKPGKEDLRPYLRRRRKRRLRKGSRRCQRIFKPKGASINERPLIVAERSRIGDWEGDTVESKDHKPGINTLVERSCGVVLITKLAKKTSEATTRAVTTRMNTLRDEVKHTLTVDNGPENQDWQTIESQTGLKCYYANPYHSWERGTNENTNGLIRDYFPKKTDFTTIPDEDISFVEKELNTRPRKRLEYLTPLEAMSVALGG
jgi:IS30 family transposase